jgi:hypothetical protein
VWTLLKWDQPAWVGIFAWMFLVAGGRIEPRTQGFSRTVS